MLQAVSAYTKRGHILFDSQFGVIAMQALQAALAQSSSIELRTQRKTLQTGI